VTYRFRFHTRLRNPGTFLCNTGPILSLNSPNWNRWQFCTVSKVDVHGRVTELGAGLACPPCNIGPLSTPNYPKLAAAAVHDLGGGVRVFAGQRAEGSTWTSGRSSTWPTCGHSSSCTTSSG
jgi:hypothetical protein